MPITLNHSNISVQYSTGTNYIIETVKSDLYVRDSRTGISSNLTGEPIPTPSAEFSESVQSFTHSGGAETQTTYTINVSRNTICDILIVGGGGGGTVGHGGGGGAGQLVFIHQAILNGTYTIKVGKGGNGSTVSGDNSSMGTLTNGTKGSDSEFGSVIAEGGGISVNTTLRDGGSGAGGDGHAADGGVAGKGLKNATVDTFSSGTVYSRGNDGGDGSAVSSGNVGQGGGGGGAGTAGTAGGLNNDSAIGHGGDGLSGISEINYDFKTNFGNYGKLEADGKYWFAGGGAGGVYYLNSSVVCNGGKGGGASTPASVAYGKINGGNGVNGTGGGGAGGSAWYGNGGNGGSGIVIIKYKSFSGISIVSEGNPITHKTLNFLYTVANPTYTLNFPVPTTTDILERTAGRGILNNSNLILQGTYDINLTASSATIVPRTGQFLPFTATSNLSQNIAFRYHLLNPIKMPEGAQWTYNSNNANVYHLGDVGIGTTNPSYDLHVNGTIFTSTGGYTQTGLTTWTVMSDRRIKENIVKASYDKCLENVKNIDLYSFNFKDNCVHTNDKNQLGFIAQEVQQVYPKAVEVGRMLLNTNETINDVLTLNTTQIDYTLYGAVKYLIEKVEMLEQKLEKKNTITNSSNVITNSSNSS